MAHLLVLQCLSCEGNEAYRHPTPSNHLVAEVRIKWTFLEGFFRLAIDDLWDIVVGQVGDGDLNVGGGLALLHSLIPQVGLSLEDRLRLVVAFMFEIAEQGVHFLGDASRIRQSRKHVDTPEVHAPAEGDARETLANAAGPTVTLDKKRALNQTVAVPLEHGCDVRIEGHIKFNEIK